MTRLQKTGLVACTVVCAGAASAAPQTRQSRVSPAASRRAAALGETCRSRIDGNDLSGAAEAARQALAIDPEAIGASLCLGVALVMDDHYAEAVAPLERVIAVSEDPDALFGLAKAYAALDDPRAGPTLDRLVAVRPDDVDVRLVLVHYLWDYGQIQRGNDEMERLIETAGGRPDLRVTYAIDLLRQRQFERAARQLEQAQAEGAKTYQVAYLLGDAWWEAGAIDRAVESFARAIEIDPAAAPAQHELGRLLLWMGRSGEAIPHLERAAAVQKSAPVSLDLGRAYEAAERLDAAVRAYRDARAIDPSLSPIYYALGRLLKRMGQADAAAEALATYQRLYDAAQQRRFTESSRRAELDFAQQQLRQGDAAAALATFERLGDTPDALIGRAKALARLKRHADAVQVLERLRAIAPDDQRVPYLLARERAAGSGAVRR